MTATALPFERPVLIRFAHCDPAGIVFFPQYHVLFNNSVEDWVSEALGISYAQLIGERRIGLPTVSLSTEFRAVSRMGEVVHMGVAVKKLGNRSITLSHQCRQGDEVRLVAEQVLVTTSLETHKSIQIPPDLRAAIEQFMKG
jgi:4-hydroxybenzoyl-CoA thioesterase